MGWKSLSQILLYITLIAFIVIKYKSNSVISETANITPDTATIIVGILYGSCALLNMLLSRSNPVLPVVLFISTCIIIYSIIKNVDSSPLVIPVEPLLVGGQNDAQNTQSIANLRINIPEFYNNKMLSKTIMTLILYTVMTFGMWFGVWKNNCSIYDLLCDQYFIFVMIYMAFSIFVLLDMFKNTKDMGFFEYFDDEKNDVIFNSNWVIYSVFYSLFLIYILIVSQSVRNTIQGTSIDVNTNFSALIAIILIIIHYVHYHRLQKARSKCNCSTATISVLNNNIKVFQYNNILLPIILVVITLVSSKSTSK